jgi:hypothetical protein
MPYDQIPYPDYSLPGFDPNSSTFGRIASGESIKYIDRDVNALLPYQQISQYNKLARHGVLGPQGARRLSAQAFRSGAGRRKAMGAGLRKRLRRRLGSRSLAAETTIANTLTAPSLVAADARTAEFELQNQMSKLQGMQGIDNLIRHLQERFNTNREFEMQEDASGPLDYLLPGLGLGLQAVDAFSGGAATAASQGVRRAFD